MNNPFNILFKYPTRGRPQRFFDGMENIMEFVVDKNSFHISVTIDDDDLTMNNHEVKKAILSYPNTSFELGKSKSKIHAINRNIPDYDFDILINMADDMKFNIFGFDDMIRVDMNYHFPNFDGLLHYPDQDAKDYLATMYIAGRKWWEFRNKNIYHPSYKSLWCDNEEMTVAQMMGKYFYCGYQINLHLNPAYGHLEKDELFNEQQGHWGEDEANFYARKEKNFDLDLSQLKITT